MDSDREWQEAAYLHFCDPKSNPAPGPHPSEAPIYVDRSKRCVPTVVRFVFWLSIAAVGIFGLQWYVTGALTPLAASIGVFFGVAACGLAAGRRMLHIAGAPTSEGLQRCLVCSRVIVPAESAGTWQPGTPATRPEDEFWPPRRNQ